ncbi:unnamed protein product [Cuscuta europaea]|uniref:Uncharacterized protein n=1 Tax=Cuscuta europaea TaxID=41803 RepID=A0A9P0ZPZ6_CUSEU|nr:unnamed protein product [Cuscuta europaea]
MNSCTAMAVFMLPKCVEDGSSNNLRPTIITCDEWVLVYRISVDSLWNDVVLRTISERNVFLDAFVPAKKKSSPALILRVERGAYIFMILTTNPWNVFDIVVI